MPGVLFTEQEHEQFLQRFERGARAMFAYGLYLHVHGFAVYIPGQQRSPHPAENFRHTDKGDLFVFENGDKLRLETKGLTTQFTTATWPHEHYFVANVASVERGLAHSYISISADFRYAGIVRGDTKPYWYVKTIVPRTTRRAEDMYCCPLDCGLVRFIEL